MFKCIQSFLSDSLPFPQLNLLLLRNHQAELIII